MPTSTTIDSMPWTIMTRKSPVSPWENPVAQTESITRRSVTKPASTFRKVPADLFAGGTGRTVTSLYNSSSTVTYSSGNTRYINRPIHNLANLARYDDSSLWPATPGAALDPILNKIRSDMRGNAVNLAMALAEYRQTAALFLAGARFISSRGGNLRSLLSRQAGVSKAYLGFQYGIKPLAGDLVGSLDALRDAAAKPIYLQGVESRRDRAVYSADGVPATTIGNGRLELHRSIRRRVQWRAKLTADGVTRTLAVHGFTNPFALAYELIPFSFVVDWWVNVGDVLQSLDNLLLFDSLTVIESTSVVRGAFFDYPGVSHIPAASCNRIRRTDTRTAPRNVSMIQTLQYKPSVSATHIANGLALLRVLRSGRR